MADDVSGAGERGDLDEEAVEGVARAVRGGMHAGVETELICDVTTAAAMWGRSCEETAETREGERRGCTWIVKERGCLDVRGRSTAPTL